MRLYSLFGSFSARELIHRPRIRSLRAAPFGGSIHWNIYCGALIDILLIAASFTARLTEYSVHCAAAPLTARLIRCAAPFTVRSITARLHPLCRALFAVRFTHCTLRISSEVRFAAPFTAWLNPQRLHSLLQHGHTRAREAHTSQSQTHMVIKLRGDQAPRISYYL